MCLVGEKDESEKPGVMTDDSQAIVTGSGCWGSWVLGVNSLTWMGARANFVNRMGARVNSLIWMGARDQLFNLDGCPGHFLTGCPIVVLHIQVVR